MLHENWIYLNVIEDERERIAEIKEIIKELHWRLRPEIYNELEKEKETVSETSEEHLHLLDTLFEKELIK